MHRHSYQGRKFNREAGPRKAMVRNLISQVILHEKIKTTLEKAKDIRPTLEKLITKAKKGTLADRRNAGKLLSNKDRALEKLFNELGPLYKERNGGYVRILKIPNRYGDNAKMAIIELLDTDKLTKKEMEKPKAKKEKKEVPKIPKAKDDKKGTKKVAKKVTAGEKK
jgi:large subunit ribosomal protein L17